MTKTRLATLAAALALVLSQPAFAQEPVEQSQEPVVEDDAESAATEGDVAATTAEAADPAAAMAVESDTPGGHRAFADLDTDADGYVSESDLPAELELSLQFAVADTDQDDRISQAEYEAYHAVPEDDEEEEAEE